IHREELERGFLCNAPFPTLSPVYGDSRVCLQRAPPGVYGGAAEEAAAKLDFLPSRPENLSSSRLLPLLSGRGKRPCRPTEK
ncbi:UNVERIFIED_CONTAM: hypothetical protein K2H54_013202, partial [Gekko kuhli]